MANDCYFSMKVTGQNENIKEFCMALTHYKNSNTYIGRGTYQGEDIEYEDGCAYVHADCPWSILTSFVDVTTKTENGIEYINIYEACNKFNVNFEVYSEELGFEFQEHFSYIDGDKFEECIDVEEFDVSEYSTKEEAEEDLEEAITDEEWEYAQTEGDGYFKRGGYPEWNFNI